MTHSERLWPGGPEFVRREGVFPMCTDSILLADFASLPRNAKIADLGCGTGLLTLLCAWDRPDLSGIALDVDAAAVENACENFHRNGLADRFSAVQTDLRQIRQLPERGRFDAVISNPPYFRVSSPGNAPERKESTLCLEELCAAVSAMLRPGGRCFLVYRPERLGELFKALDSHGLVPKRLRLIQERWNSAPCGVLLEARLRAGEGMRTEPVLLLKNADGTPSEEYRRIYRRQEECL